VALPLLDYALESQNSRVKDHGGADDDQARVFSTQKVLGDADYTALIEAAYQQIFFHAFKYSRDAFLESQLRNNQITVRDFIRGLLLSDTFRSSFYRFNSNYQVVTQMVQRVWVGTSMARRKPLPGPSSSATRVWWAWWTPC